MAQYFHINDESEIYQICFWISKMGSCVDHLTSFHVQDVPSPVVPDGIPHHDRRKLQVLSSHGVLVQFSHLLHKCES
ncbi:hypothetical protein AMTRI_Chr08g162510 [Amborella trichopoda]